MIGALEAMWRLVILFLTSMLQFSYGTAFVLKVVFAYTIFIMNKPYIHNITFYERHATLILAVLEFSLSTNYTEVALDCVAFGL